MQIELIGGYLLAMSERPHTELLESGGAGLGELEAQRVPPWNDYHLSRASCLQIEISRR
jgi:hypothetical protein